jgi:hypothetical protein
MIEDGKYLKIIWTLECVIVQAIIYEKGNRTRKIFENKK